MTNTTGPRLPWAGRIVRIEDVEEQLSLFWRMTADNVRTSQNINVRTSVLNLVICAPDVETAQRASATIRDLSSTHVARVILLVLDTTEGSPGAVTTWATLRSFPIISDTMRHNFEQVTVLVAGSAIRATSNILQPLLKPHLPTYIWWLGDPPSDNTLLRNLTQLSNRIIVDSSSFFQPEQSLHTLVSFLDEAPDCALSDLNWGRITPWRSLVAQFFDMAEFKSYLGGIDTINIEHAVTNTVQTTRTALGDISPSPTRALFLAAWLKTRLGWQLSANASDAHHNESSGTYDWQMIRASSAPARASGSSKSGKLSLANAFGTMHIRPRYDDSMPPGAICLFHMISKVDSKHATFTINRADEEHVTTVVELDKTNLPQRTVSLAAESAVSALLHDELEIMGRDHLYEETLRAMVQLLQ